MTVQLFSFFLFLWYSIFFFFYIYLSCYFFVWRRRDVSFVGGDAGQDNRAPLYYEIDEELNSL
jgi:hypothetical protein